MESGIINSLFNGFSKPQVSDDRLNENQNFEYNLEIIGHAVSSGYYTYAVAVVIRVPPAAPLITRTRPVVALTTMVGAMDDIGLLPGLMKLAGLGGTPK